MSDEEQLQALEEAEETDEAKASAAEHIEEEVIEMEIEDGDIYAYLVDEDDNEIGFVLLDEDGNEEEYYYVNMDEYEFVDEEDAVSAANSNANNTSANTPTVHAKNDKSSNAGLSREAIAEATDDVNAIYKEGVAVATELKEAFSDISDGLGSFKRRR